MDTVMHTAVIQITPLMAETWLNSSNSANRNISQRQVDKLAYDMANGNWRQTHQGIAFYEDGMLADGQHRLAAIVQSGIAQDMLVVTGLAKADAIGIDQHRTRSMVDVIRIAGGDQWINRSIVAISRFMLTKRACKVLSVNQIHNFSLKYRDDLEFTVSAFKAKRRGITSASVQAAVFAASVNGIDRHDLAEFVSILTSGAATSPCHLAAIRLREWLMKPCSDHGAVYHASCYLRAQRAIEAFVSKQPISRLFEPSAPIWTIPEDAA